MVTSPAIACTGDINGSGVVDGEDLALLLAAWKQSGQGDLDGNGVIDGSDLALLLGNWGECPEQTLQTLFDEPTRQELMAVRNDWDSRDLSPQGWTVHGSGTFSGLTVEVVSHVLDGNRHYGFIRYPEGYSDSGSYPVLILNHGGQNGVGLGILGQASQSCLREFVVIVPSFRGELLRTESLGLGDFLSEGPNSEFDGDIDDTISLLNGTLAHVPGADENMILAHGGSRGGCVTHLLSIRDTRIKGAVVFFGATDHMLDSIRDQVIEIIDNGAPAGNPVINTVLNYAVDPWLNGQISFGQARLELIRRSAIHFADTSPMPMEVHHGTRDFVVPVIHSRNFDDLMQELGNGDLGFVYWEYPGGGHGSNMSEAFGRMQQFMCNQVD
ncbi:MAG: hypothetical protein CMJ32_04750 [Phycisphaerae bacterium]|nr:hypothetical protein [Phycisphaerae bacterium]